MTSSTSSGYPGDHLTVPQLLNALNRKFAEATGASVRADFTIDQFDGLENQTVKALAGIRSFRNAFAPINRLNPDIFANIFHFLVEDFFQYGGDDDDDEEDTQDNNHSYGWIFATHVCSYWRNVSLAIPQLWSVIDSRCPAIAQLCIERSQTTSLHVILRAECPDVLIAGLSGTMDRTEVFDSCLQVDQQLPVLALLTKRAHYLQSLSIILPGSVFSDVVMPSLTSTLMPSLKTLTISGLLVDESLQTLTHLVRLELLHDMSTPSMTAFLDIFQANTSLKEIILVAAGPVDDDENINRIVELPNIRLLHLCYTSVAELLRHISLPPGCRLAVQKRIENHDGTNMLEEVIGSSVHQLQNIKDLETLSFVAEGSRLCMVSAVGPQGTVDLWAEDDTTGVPHSDITLETFRSLAPLSLATIKELWVEDAEHWGKVTEDIQNHTRFECFSQLIQLEKLTLANCRPELFLSTLHVEEGGNIVCPKLAEMTLQDSKELEVDQLVDCVKSRKESGAAIKNLTIICYPEMFAPGDKIMELKQYVGKLLVVLDNEAPAWPFDPVPWI